MAATGAPAAGSGFGSTLRRDAWWVEILPVIVLVGGFGLYATLRAFEGKFYEWGPYLSPFYSPLIDANHRWWKLSPAILILGGPLSFRATCYYYRKAYYRAFFADPPALRRRRAEALVQRRNELSVHPAKPASLRACISPSFSSRSCGKMRTTRFGGTENLAWASARSCCS